MEVIMDNKCINILHLSDLHFGEKSRYEEEPKDLAKRCVASIRQGNIPDPNLVIITGDFAESAATKEYTNALQFIKEMCKQFNLDNSRFV
jgi:3',5'-cyclic AMP phosphodiesterase CpdA